jgi:Tol biopolymer transport system component
LIDSTELWVHDLSRDTLTRLVEDATSIEDPEWSPDGRMVYYRAGEVGRFRRIRAEPGAEAETVFEGTDGASLAPDGSGMLVRVGGFRLTEEQGFYWVPFDENGDPGERRKVLSSALAYGRLSPDNRMLAYGSMDTGKYETFLTSFPEIDQTIQISSGGGGAPRWSADGQSAFYTDNGAVVEVEVGFDPDGRLTASSARGLFELDAAHLMSRQGWNVDPDGSGFLFVKSLETDTRTEIVVRRNALDGMTSDP